MSLTSSYPIGRSPQQPTLRFAGTELQRYLGMMGGTEALASVDIRLGCFSDFDRNFAGFAESVDDDAFWIEVTESRGLIAGSNPRSVLFGVYRFLEQIGCRWVRPGPDGDHVPARDIRHLTVDLRITAAQRVRGFNDCGSYPLESILAKIEWAPKVGLNSFMSEFFTKDWLYNKHYRHPLPSQRPPALRSTREILAFQHQVEDAVALRGMTYHAIGHGWTGIVGGLAEHECIPDADVDVRDSFRHHLALVNGERKLQSADPYSLSFASAPPRPGRG